MSDNYDPTTDCFKCSNCGKFNILSLALTVIRYRNNIEIDYNNLLCHDCSVLDMEINTFFNNYHEEYEAQVGMD